MLLRQIQSEYKLITMQCQAEVEKKVREVLQASLIGSSESRKNRECCAFDDRLVGDTPDS